MPRSRPECVSGSRRPTPPTCCAWAFSLGLGLLASGTHAAWKLEFSSYLNGNRHDEANAVAFTPSGNVVVVGETSSRDFPTVNPIQAEPVGGNREGFVAMLDPTTGTLLASTYLGGRHGWDVAEDVAVDGAGNIYVVGTTCGTGFPVRNAIQSERPSEGCNGFLTKFSPALDEILFSTYLGGSDGSSDLVAVAADQEGVVWVAGSSGEGFPLSNPLLEMHGGAVDPVIARVDTVEGRLLSLK